MQAMLLSPAYDSHFSDHVHHFSFLNYFRFRRRSTDATLNVNQNTGIWNRLTKKGRDTTERQLQQQQMALSRQRLVTLVYGDMETVKMVRVHLRAASRC